MTKRYNARAIKKHHTYTVEEVAEALGAHVQTVRSWAGQGLRIMKSKTPHLILGDDVRKFLGDRARGRKQPLSGNELYCLRCRAAKIPEGKLADFTPSEGGRGRLSGICPDCGGMCQRFARADRLNEIGPNLDISIPAQVKRLKEEA